MIGNNWCDDETNNENCNFDGGDCCGLYVQTNYCKECLCHENCTESYELVANGQCNDETNNADCSFDGGDCCGSCKNTDYCIECMCHAESPINLLCRLLFLPIL